MSAIQQVRMSPCSSFRVEPNGETSPVRNYIEVCIDRGGHWEGVGRYLRLAEWRRDVQVREFESWGLALAWINAETAGPPRENPSPPSGTTEVDAAAMAEEQQRRAA